MPQLPQLPHPLQTPLALSITLESLPRRRPVRIRHLPTGHLLVVIADGLEITHLERIYRTLRAPVRHLIYQANGVPDPDLDPRGYQERAWWPAGGTATFDLVDHLESQRRITPWPHGAATPARFRA